jgi:hypothetical protein
MAPDSSDFCGVNNLFVGGLPDACLGFDVIAGIFYTVVGLAAESVRQDLPAGDPHVWIFSAVLELRLADRHTFSQADTVNLRSRF